MLNKPEAYLECGRKVATYYNKHDAAGADFEKRWLSRALSMEKPEDRIEAGRLYDQGWAEARIVPRMERFL